MRPADPSGAKAKGLRFRPARPEEAAALSALALRSKAVWGYDAEFLERCRGELTFSPADLAARRVQVAEEEGKVRGLVSIGGVPPKGELAELYVDPAAIGRGFGSALLAHALELASAAGFRELFIHSDPNAAAFYLRHGAQAAGTVPSGSIPGRSLPLLRLAVPEGR